jgi:hypothetical protein
MVPTGEQPVRPSKIAEIVDALLQTAPSGTTVLAQEEVWTLAQLRSDDLPQALKARFDVSGKIS